MGAVGLGEVVLYAVLKQVRQNIAPALSAVRTDRSDAKVSTEPPESYFVYPTEQEFKAPSVFVILDSMDFRQAQNGANHVSGLARINVSVVVEDRNQELLLIKALRYQAALHTVLDRARLTSSNNQITMIVVVTRASFSSDYSSSKKSPDSAFRKEILLECEVEHYENQ